MPTPLLQLCARTSRPADLNSRLVDCCRSITDWDSLLAEGERHGVNPLLHWHLQSLAEACPARAQMALRLVYLRHHRTNTVYASVLREVIRLFDHAGIDVLVLKGEALSHTVYPDIGLRPLRDIDLLVRAEQAETAQQILISEGFAASRAPRPADHFHLPSLHSKVRNISVCIELHTGLFPDCPPYYAKVDFDVLLGRSRQFSITDTDARCMGDEDMLWHVFEHGFHMPLTYEPFRLVSVADIFALVETRLQFIDWEKMAEKQPLIMSALPLFHQLTPWQQEVVDRFSWDLGEPRKDAGKSFNGWPHLRMAEQHDQPLLAILDRTFNPPSWWCRLYYGVTNWWEMLRCRLIDHPAHILWWVRLYSSFVTFDTGKEMTTAGIPRRPNFFMKSRAVMQKLLRGSGRKSP